MAMTVDSIRAVKDADAYRLLSEPRFEVYGKRYELMTKVELSQIGIVNTAGVERNDFIEEEVSIPRNIASMADIYSQKIYFDLVDIKDARLIYTCIDHFLMAQANNVTEYLGGITSEMLEDFQSLTDLANYMLSFIDVADRIDLMNAPKEDKKYVSVFDFAMGNIGKATLTAVPEAYDTNIVREDEGYQSPFTALLSRRAINRTDRFKG